jgi:hypothetical protein
MESIKLEMEDAKVTWNREVQNQKEIIEAARIEQLALVEECKALRSALVSSEEEREVLKVQNFQAQTELKEFDVEVQRQRQEIELAERDLEVAKHVAVVDLQRVEEERDELLQIIRELKEESAQLKMLLSDEESQSRDAKMKMISLVLTSMSFRNY